MRHVCVDACFLIALYDKRDQHHEEAISCFLDLFDGGNNRMLVPWPILYETISTRLVRDMGGMRRMQMDWSRLRRNERLQLLSDEPYRTNVIDDCFDELGKPPGSYRKLSAVDRVVRNILMEPRISIRAFVTFNRPDFADVARKAGMELIP